ncbi:class I SAM-dependent methyltransferase, partial [Patescibacteria group bacterium]|nr:class I SAM-dependent methyltransferase [Patescibacteria group bacterium]
PKAILKQLDIHDNIQVADFGCGHGYFSIPLAKAANQGKVYILDVQKSALEAVKSQAKLDKVDNIEAIHCNLEIPNGSKLSDNSIDLVVLVNILFQTEKKGEIIREARRVLRKQGQMVIIDWIPNSSLAPKKGWTILKDETRKITEEKKMIFEKDLEINNQHYGMVFRK